MQENSSIARPHSYKRETWYRQSAVGQAPQQITKNNILGPEFLGLSGSAARSPDMINILKRLNTKRFCVACSINYLCRYYESRERGILCSPSREIEKKVPLFL